MSSSNLRTQDVSQKLIECQTCFRTFRTQAQFGQHSRICRGGKSVAHKLIDISSQPYKYCFLEKQTKDKLEIKSRFIMRICNVSINWKDISKKNNLSDSGIAQLLKSKDLGNVHVAIRHRKGSGLIVANFVIRSVEQTPQCIHTAKICIEEAVDEVKNKLPNQIEMDMHLCKINDCKELVIRDTEGFCSRHRAQEYHKKFVKKRKNQQMQQELSQLQNMTNTNSESIQFEPPANKRMKLCCPPSDEHKEFIDNHEYIQSSQCIQYNHCNPPQSHNQYNSNAHSQQSHFPQPQSNFPHPPPVNNQYNHNTHSPLPQPQSNVYNHQYSNQYSQTCQMQFQQFQQQLLQIQKMQQMQQLQQQMQQMQQMQPIQYHQIQAAQPMQPTQQMMQTMQQIQPMQMQQMQPIQPMTPQLQQLQPITSMTPMTPQCDSASVTSDEREGKNVMQYTHNPLTSKQISFSPLLNQLREFFNSNSYIVETPQSLYGVPINKSSLRRNGMNIISVDYSTSVPNAKQVLQKDGQLVVFGPKNDTQKYFDNIGEKQDLVNCSDALKLDSIRFPEFCQELTQNYIACVPAPECLIGSTLAQTPQLAQSGINAIAVNLQLQHASKMCNTPFKENDMLLCCFNRADDKQQQLKNAFEQIELIKQVKSDESETQKQ